MQRVLIIESDLLLGAGIANLLTAETGLDLAGITPDDVAELLHEISRFQPDVIILDQATYLIDSLRLLTLLKNQAELRLIVVSTDDNRVDIYHKQQNRVSCATDLVKIIRRS